MPSAASRAGSVDRPLRILAVADARSIHTLRWAGRLADRGHDVHVVSNRVGADPRETEGITVHDLLRLDPLMRVPRLRRLRFGPAIRRLAERVAADVVHGHGITPYAYWAALAEVHPFVVSPWGRDVLVDALKEPGHSRALRTWRSADYLVVNSGAIEQAAVAAGADPSRIAHIIWHTQLAGFGPEQADPAGLRAELGWPADALIVLSLRNFQARTNIDVLVAAFAQVAARHPRARLLLAARGGEARPQVEAAMAQAGLGEAIRIHRVDPDGLPRLAASGDIVVSIADTDSSPSSLLEAMASGNPLVGGWCASIDEWIGPGEGAEMVQPRDRDALAAALDRLLSDAALRERYAQRNLRVVRERVAESAPALEALYRRLIAEHAGSSRGRAS
jgi:glycosyltransferase involved in cell wall biosynthesis